MNFKELFEKTPNLMKLHQMCVREEIEAHVIGGFVRDAILKETSKDIDIVVVGKSGIDFAFECAKELFVSRHKVNFFKNFGTANFVAEGVELEFVGARKESYNRGSRNPIVEDGTLFDDQQRRDFTINAMSIDLRTIELVDPFNGMKDLTDGIIKTPVNPDITFSDDPLRQLRAIRFAARFNFEIESNTFTAIAKHVERLDIISHERVLSELNKTLLTKNPKYGLQLMFDSGLLNKILPEVCKLDGVDEKNGQRHKNNFTHTIQVVQQTREVSSDLDVLWTALLHDIGKTRTKRFEESQGWTFHNHERIGAYMVRKIATRLKFSNDSTDKIIHLVENHGRPKELTKDDVSASAIRRLVVDMKDNLQDLLLFCSCDITTKFGDKRERQVKELVDLFIRVQRIETDDNLKNFKVPVTGEEIMKHFNLKPSKEVGLIKDAIKEAILEGECKNDHDIAFNYMLEIAPEILGA